MRERESGYYWVKHNGEWVVAEYRIRYWFYLNMGSGATDAIWDEIDERKIVREEPMDFEQTREALKKDYEYLCREYERLSGKQWKEPLPKLKIFGR